MEKNLMCKSQGLQAIISFFLSDDLQKYEKKVFNFFFIKEPKCTYWVVVDLHWNYSRCIEKKVRARSRAHA